MKYYCLLILCCSIVQLSVVMAASTKTERRAQREEGVRNLNELAAQAGVDPIRTRPAVEEVVGLVRSLQCKLGPDDMPALQEAVDFWRENGGGGDFPNFVEPQEEMVDTPEGESVPYHKELVRRSGRAFRLCSKAFMLTFNSLVFANSPELWASFQAWVEEKKHAYKANYWSATMEESLESGEAGRVHLHCYLSWHGSSKGVDHSTTDAFVFKDVRPRVDCNTEHRGPWNWLKATQHGHFYVAVWKLGTLQTATNYAAWGGLWVPDAQWVTGLWRHHKITHDQYMELSLKLRDGHDRRKATVEAVVNGELSFKYAEEKKEARRLIAMSAKPFKPFPDAIQKWRAQYDQPEERYKMLVLFGPSCTGKSRLARKLFGDGSTLVVDVQHAEHPDLRGYRRHKHKAVLLDEVSSPKFIVGNKKLLQAHADGAILGQSATQLYTYEVFLWRTPIMLTTNNWDYSTYSASDQNWIETNTVAVHIAERVWVSGPSAPEGDSVSTPRQQPEAAVRRVWASPNRK